MLKLLGLDYSETATELKPSQTKIKYVSKGHTQSFNEKGGFLSPKSVKREATGNKL